MDISVKNARYISCEESDQIPGWMDVVIMCLPFKGYSFKYCHFNADTIWVILMPGTPKHASLCCIFGVFPTSFNITSSVPSFLCSQEQALPAISQWSDWTDFLSECSAASIMPIGYYLRRYVGWCSCTTLPISETDSELSFGDPVLLLQDWCVINLSAECSPVIDVHGSAEVHSLDDHRSDTTSNPEIILTGTDASVEYLYAKPLNQTSNLRERTLEDASSSRSRQHRREPDRGVNEMGSRTRSRKNATTFKPLEEEFLSREQIYRLYGELRFELESRVLILCVF